MPIANVRKFEYGGLAGLLVAQKDIGLARGSLEKLDDALQLGEDAKGFIQGTYSSEQGIATASQVYAKKYEEALNSTFVEDLFNDYNSRLLNAYLEPHEIEKIKAKLQPHFREDFGNLSKPLARAEHILKGEDSNYEHTDQEKRWARETKDRYEKAVALIITLDHIKLEELRGEAVKKAHKASLKKLIEKL